MSLSNYKKVFSAIRSSNQPQPSAPSLITPPSFQSQASTFCPFDYIEEADSVYPTSSGSIKTSSWHMIAELSLKTNRTVKSWDDLLEDLGLIIDHYEGSVNYKNIFIIIYLLLGTHLKPRGKTMSGLSQYYISADTRIQILHKFDLVGQDQKEINWAYTSPGTIRKCEIKYKCSLMPTKRSGHPVKKLYSIQSIPGLSPPLFTEVLKPYGLSLEESADDFVLFNLSN